MLNKEKQKQIIDFLVAKTNCCAIIIFGSYARDYERPDSDLDIAIKTDKKLTNIEIFNLQNELEDIIKIEVDLIDLSQEMGDGFRYEILISGILIYCTNEFKFDLYKLRMFREYLELNESRQEILKQLKEGDLYNGKQNSNNK